MELAEILAVAASNDELPPLVHEGLSIAPDVRPSTANSSGIPFIENVPQSWPRQFPLDDPTSPARIAPNRGVPTDLAGVSR